MRMYPVRQSQDLVLGGEDDNKSSPHLRDVRDLGYSFRDIARIPHDYGSMKDAMDAATLRSYLKLDQANGATTVAQTLEDMINEKFVPAGSCEALVKEQFSGQYHTEEMRDGLLTEIRGRCRILATLLMMRELPLFDRFLDNNLFDKDLPLHLPEKNTKNGQPASLALSKDCHRVLFRHYQHCFLAPYFAFDMDPHCYILSTDTRLPLLVLETLQQSNYRGVYKIQIHEEHHNFPRYQDAHGNIQEPYFALKKVNDDTFRGELEALRKVSCKPYKTNHLVSLLLAIDQGQDKYLLFEYADGDLRQFWKTFDKTTTQTRPASLTQRWAACQCLGLATALKLVHGEATMDVQRRKALAASRLTSAQSRNTDFGRHGDIKPRNILWFAHRKGEDNLLVLTDLGSTSFNSEESRSNLPNPGGGTDRYEAPQAVTTRKVSRMCDIWSLGCVFLEFCIWWLEGYKGVAAFEDDCVKTQRSTDSYWRDNYYLLSETGQAEVKPVVYKKVAELQKEHPEDIFAQNLLRLIQEDMIVVDLGDRKAIDMICAELQCLVEKVRGESGG